MRRFRWQFFLGLPLIVLSISLYLTHYVIFRDLDHICHWSLTSLAFLPISVLFVTLIVNQLLGSREKRLRLQKMNMLIGVFFSKVGTELLRCFSEWNPQSDAIREHLIVTNDWSAEEFLSVSEYLRSSDYGVAMQKVDLKCLRSFLLGKEDFLLRLLENPHVLEHISFTEVLQAVFHLADELSYREDVTQLPDSDKTHLGGDIKRSYNLLASQWLDYMKYLKDNYPYLFSLALRTNPFDKEISPIVK
ncbi:hypothetical protein H8E77_06080 [bacterium]|nr:hypothetical protein [bacterium]